MKLIPLAIAALALIQGFAIPARAQSGESVKLAGAGATFPQSLYERWVVEYQKAHPNVKIDYQGIGSGGGIKAITDKTVAFAASDAPLTKRELEVIGGPEKILEFPSCAGGVVAAYNVPGLETQLKLTGPVLADIFAGKIGKWNDPRIAELNPGAKLPNLAIVPAYRTDGSGTTFVFTNYLAGQSDDFRGSVGMGKSVKWPVGQGGKGNPGVAAIVQQTGGAVGYIEHNYATNNKLAYAAIKNSAGEFISASPETITAAADAIDQSLKAPRLVGDIWNQPAKNAYPISSFTYLIVYRDLNNLQTPAEASALVDFLRWTMGRGQDLAASLDYAPLSGGIRKKVDDALLTLTYKGAPVGSRLPAEVHAPGQPATAGSDKK